jgi:hypothetical protein
MVGAAACHGLADALRTELARSQPDLLARIERSVPSMFPKAYRWVAEMEQIADFIGEENRGSAMYQGVARLYQQVADETNRPSGWLSALISFCQPHK